MTYLVDLAVLDIVLLCILKDEVQIVGQVVNVIIAIVLYYTQYHNKHN